MISPIKRIAAGLLILSEYDTIGDSVVFEHDQLWAGPDNAAEVSPEIGAILLRLGWEVDPDVERWTYR